MQQLWVPASKTLSLIARELGGAYPAILAICKRAHAGLLRSQAQLIVAPNQRLENFAIPSEFWWAEGNDGLEQDWAQGDFSTRIEGRHEWKVFGVQFDFEGLRSMLTPQSAASAARELSVAGDPSWISVKEARTFVFDRFKTNPTSAGPVLLDYCKLGFVPARALLMQRKGNGSSGKFNLEIREWDVPEWFWQNFGTSERATQDWERGVFAAYGSGSECVFTYLLTGVYVERVALEALAPGKPEATVNVADTGRGGRPRKGWWDDLWCSLWGQIVHGELTPTNQADIERAMLQWVSDRGESVAESTVKPMAKKVWLEWDREARN